MNAIHPSSRAVTLAVLVWLCLILPATTSAQTAAPEGPMAPPEVAPSSRLTVTPAEFEQWMAGLAPGGESQIATEPDTTPTLVTPPPSPPSLVTPPAAPVLVTPPAPPKIAPVPSAAPEPKPAPATAPAPVAPPSVPTPPSAPPAAAATPPVPSAPQPPGPALTAPPAPVLKPPEKPGNASLPPDSAVTTLPAPAAEPLARPDELKLLYPEGVMEVPEAAKPDLDRLAAWLRQTPAARMQVIGYASGNDKAGRGAKRTSFLRVLTVRKYLSDRGVVSTRVNLCAFGTETAKLPRDRVELLPLLDTPAMDCEVLQQMREAQ